MEDVVMPSKKTVRKAKEDLREGKRPSTAAGEFVREEFEHVRHGKHGARSAKQVVAIGLQKARRAGIPLPPPKRGGSRRSAQRAYQEGQGVRTPRRPSPRRSRAVLQALKREGRSAASHRAIATVARKAALARARRAAARRAAARRAAAARWSGSRRSARGSKGARQTRRPASR